MDYIFNGLDWADFFERKKKLVDFNGSMDCFGPSIRIQIYIHQIHPFCHPNHNDQNDLRNKNLKS